MLRQLKKKIRMFKLSAAQQAVDFGLSVLKAGPMGPDEKRYHRILILKWRQIERRKKREMLCTKN